MLCTRMLALLVKIILLILLLNDTPALAGGVVNEQNTPDFESLASAVRAGNIKRIYELLRETSSTSYESINVDYTHQVLPPLWAEIPALTEEHFKLDANGALIIDAWEYRHRMALYKHLVQNVHHCEWDSDLPSEIYPTNILWGLPLQHGWQYASGRLNSEQGNETTTIDSQSWWGDMNYYLSILPYFGAVSVGIAPRIVIPTNPDPASFCVNPDDCPADVGPWTDFFTLVQSTRDNCSTSYASVSNTPIANYIDFNLTTGLETLLHSLWSAHLHSIDTALPKFEAQLALMADSEARFSESWATLVDFIASTYFLCDLKTTDVLQNLLPPRVLNDGDQAPSIEDMTRLQNRAIIFIEALDQLNTATQDGFLRLWDISMCGEEERALGREMVTLGVYRPTIFAKDSLIILDLLLSDASCLVT